jgi:transposase-like protein
LDRGAERARWIGRYRASGLSLKRFAEQHGLSSGQLHYWVYGSSKRKEAPMSVPVFQEVSWPASQGASVGLRPEQLSALIAGLEVTEKAGWYRR